MKAKTKYNISEPVTALTLRFDRWKNLFADDTRKILFAGALNYCIDADQSKTTRLIGYLITSSAAHVVFKMTSYRVRQALFLVKEELEREIRHEITRLKTMPLTDAEKEKLMVIDLSPRNYFEETELRNDLLIRILTGQKIMLPYFNPELKRLEDEANNSRFCSVLDYSGAVGPVQVTLVRTKQQEK